MFASGKVRVGLFVLILLLITLFMYLFSQSSEISYTELGGTSYSNYEKAKVLKVISQELEKDPTRGNLYHGSQQLEVKILSGEHKGTVHTITNNLSVYLNVLAKEGQTIIVNVDTADPEHYLVNVYSYYRAPVLLAMILLFFAILWGIGGKKV